MLNPGDLVEAWDWPEVVRRTFGVLRRAKVRGKVKAVENGTMHIWTESYGETWSNLRSLPVEYVIRRRGGKDPDALERERVRQRRKREAYRRLGIRA